MPIQLPHKLVDFILLGPQDDRRLLQDSPILGDVWLAFADKPGDRLDLLVTPFKESASGKVASRLARSLREGKGKKTAGAADIAYLQGIVAAKLTFEEVLRHVVPMTAWWGEDRIKNHIQEYVGDSGAIGGIFGEIVRSYQAWPLVVSSRAIRDVPSHTRYICLAGLVLWAGRVGGKGTQPVPEDLTELLLKKTTQRQIVDALRELLPKSPPKPAPAAEQPRVWNVSLNRKATAALSKSVPAVKADSARDLFTVDCKEIAWAVLDSGIDANHPAFRDEDGKSRIKRAFDFTRIREIVNLDNTWEDTARGRLADLLRQDLLILEEKRSRQEKEALREKTVQDMQRLARDADEGRPINWELVEKLIEIQPGTGNLGNHGTHVAGILGANREGRLSDKDEPHADAADGMCPDIQIWDFRVIGRTLEDTEFAIIGALQYIRYLNERNNFMTIHGANLSLSIKHYVRNFACGRTPVCNECERLVNSGVVVVAAAGNHGHQTFQTESGPYEGYAAFSITDPGNADGVITVGATHRFWPHTYGVSYFSSRGPTGDGRLKPDLVAPGERIRAPIPGGDWADLDGTSMAAPHVSGAAAMLMARYAEFIGQPRRIKQILCDSATDLGRERSFQGRGMLDVLRAFQSV